MATPETGADIPVRLAAHGWSLRPSGPDCPRHVAIAQASEVSTEELHSELRKSCLGSRRGKPDLPFF